MKFTVDISIESGMQTPDDVAIALRDVARDISNGGMPAMMAGLVRDAYGNTVGSYALDLDDNE